MTGSASSGSAEAGSLGSEGVCVQFSPSTAPGPHLYTAKFFVNMRQKEKFDLALQQEMQSRIPEEATQAKVEPWSIEGAIATVTLGEVIQVQCKDFPTFKDILNNVVSSMGLQDFPMQEIVTRARDVARDYQQQPNERG